MRWLSILTALLVMLRVSGLAPDLPWGWAFSPLWLGVVVLTVFLLIGLAVCWRVK